LTVSLNLAVLVMSFTAPYNLITQILIAGNSQSIPNGGIGLFLASLKNTYFIFAIVNTLAIIPAAIGGRVRKAEAEPPVAEG